MYSICTVYVQYMYASKAYIYCTYTVQILYICQGKTKKKTLEPDSKATRIDSVATGKKKPRK